MLHNERGRKVHRNYVNGFHKKNPCLGERGHYGPKNDTYFWICSKKTEFSLMVADRRGFPLQRKFWKIPPNKTKIPPPPIDEKLKGGPTLKKVLSRKKIGQNFQEIIPHIKETVKKTQKFKKFCCGELSCVFPYPSIPHNMMLPSKCPPDTMLSPLQWPQYEANQQDLGDEGHWWGRSGKSPTPVTTRGRTWELKGARRYMKKLLKVRKEVHENYINGLFF